MRFHFVKYFLQVASLLAALSLCACAGRDLSGRVIDNNLYVGGVAQPQGNVALGGSYVFRFLEKWKISHSWVQGTGIRPCLYRTNLFKRIKGYPALEAEPNAALFEKNSRIYYASTTEANPNQIVFMDLSYQFFGEQESTRQFNGKYTPFCEQPFSSPNGMSLRIVKPDSSKGTDFWIENSSPIRINDNIWWVKKIPAIDLGLGSDRAKTIEHWTLQIPETSYWIHLQFSGSKRSIEEFTNEHYVLLNLFHQVIQSIQLQPITPVSPTSMPPFVIYKPAPRKSAS